MKTTLLQIVQSILSDMDSEGVNSIGDTIEAQQIASVVEDTYYNIIAARDIPEHNKLMSLTAAGNSAKPTHFSYPTNTKHVERIEYNVGTVADKNYQTISYVEPMVFLDRMDEDDLRVETFEAGVDIFVNSTKAPTYYTSFDDEYIIMNAYDSTVEAALQNNKIRAFGSTYPVFSQTDTHTMLPMLLAESKSACFSLFKGGPDPKVEQSSRRLKSYIQNDMHKSSRANIKNNYGRK
jgi:hypothetical protein